LPEEKIFRAVVSAAELEQMFQPMLDRAVEEGLFFYNRERFFDLWFSPREFQELIFEGASWIRRQWLLKDPQVRITELERSIYFLEEELKSMKREVVELKIMKEPGMNHTGKT